MKTKMIGFRIVKLQGYEEDIDKYITDAAEIEVNNPAVSEEAWWSDPMLPNKHDHLVNAVESIIEQTKEGGGFTKEMRKKLEDELTRLKGGS